ncbi:MAG: metallophosphoesterase, partial [Sediminibacterium sp.]
AYMALVQCLERSAFDVQEDRLIQLGDVADGYPDVYECVEKLLDMDRLIAIKGNHDEWFERFILYDWHPTFFSQGGISTAVSYMKRANLGKKNYSSTGYGFKTALTKSNIPFEHRKFFTKTQRLHFIDNDNRCFVHGGFNRFEPFKDQKEERYYWDRELWQDALNHVALEQEGRLENEFICKTEFKEIYIGHTTTTKWHTDKPMRALNIFNLDTGAGHNGRLTIMNVDTKGYWQSDPVGELYEHRI